MRNNGYVARAFGADGQIIGGPWRTATLPPPGAARAKARPSIAPVTAAQVRKLAIESGTPAATLGPAIEELRQWANTRRRMSLTAEQRDALLKLIDVKSGHRPPAIMRSGPMEYFEIRSATVEPWESITAQLAADYSARRLGITPATVAYFVAADDRRHKTPGAVEFRGELRMMGFTFPSLVSDALMVRLGPGRTRRDIARTVAHEVRHLWQGRAGVFGNPCLEDLHEDDAATFAAEIVADLDVPDLAA